MIKDDKNRYGSQQGVIRLIIGILIFGSIWGFLEATLGGFLHMIIFPAKGAIMSGIGVAIMASALAIYKKPAMLLGIGIVAASFKLLDVWLFALPVSSIHIINPAMAIIFESLVFSLVAVFVMNKLTRNAPVGVGTGVLVGLISATAWVYFAIYVMNAPAYNRVLTTVGAYVVNQGVVQAVFFGVFLPLGYLVGEKLVATASSVLVRRPLYYYATSAALICFCWGISIVAIMAGL